ncbi:MAG TPA: ATP-binding protein [Bacteroidota bacterium]|nr:ATP-binding protein [Bacteroidota bacterium]
MLYKRFWLNAVARITLLCGLICLFFFLLFQTGFYATATLVALIVAYQTYALIRYVTKTNNDLSRFVRSIEYDDFSQTFTGGRRGRSFDELALAFTAVMNRFRATRAEKEEHFRYLQTVVEHVGVGLIAYRPNGEVELVNNAAKRLLDIPHLRTIGTLESKSRALVETLLSLRAGERALIKVEAGHEPLQLVLHATEFRARGDSVTLVSVQNIQGELEEKELEAWQNLIRVLTHEIMNSITPISSLASTARDLMGPEPPGSGEPAGEPSGDIRRALETIHKRSQGLLHFVETYRTLTRIPKPRFQTVRVCDLFGRLRSLMDPQMGAASLSLETEIVPADLELNADPALLEEVLINLVTNALQALSGTPGGKIRVSASLDGRGRVLLAVADNGPGITPEQLEKVFVPFYTTKPSGSGIGLSLCRGIMRAHRGTILARSRPGVETVFTLKF